MKDALIILPLFILFLFGCSSSREAAYKNIPEPGAKVSIMMNDGRKYEGELLQVYDSTMTVCEEFGVSEQDLKDSVFTIYTIRNLDIGTMEINVKSKAEYGVIFGGLMGSLIGVSAGKDGSKEEKKTDDNGLGINLFNIDKGALAGCCIGGLIGAFAAGIIVFEITNSEVVYEQADAGTYDFNQLNIYSRYGSEGTENLKGIE